MIISFITYKTSYICINLNWQRVFVIMRLVREWNTVFNVSFWAPWLPFQIGVDSIIWNPISSRFLCHESNCTLFPNLSADWRSSKKSRDILNVSWYKRCYINLVIWQQRLCPDEFERFLVLFLCPVQIVFFIFFFKKLCSDFHTDFRIYSREIDGIKFHFYRFISGNFCCLLLREPLFRIVCGEVFVRFPVSQIHW